MMHGNDIPPPPAYDDAPPSYEATVNEMPVVFGIEESSAQVICPVCQILLALPSGMLYFRCPRCHTECVAPPKVAVGPPLQTMNYLPPMHTFTPPFQQLAPPFQQSAPLFQPSTPPSSNNYVEKKLERIQFIDDSRDQKQIISRKEQIKKNQLREINYPEGRDAHTTSSFLLMLIPFFNLVWVLYAYFRICNENFQTPNPIAVWYDTNRAKTGVKQGGILFMIIMVIVFIAGTAAHNTGATIFASTEFLLFLLIIAFYGSATGKRLQEKGCGRCDCGNCDAQFDCGSCECGDCDCGGCDC